MALESPILGGLEGGRGLVSLQEALHSWMQLGKLRSYCLGLSRN